MQYFSLSKIVVFVWTVLFLIYFQVITELLSNKVVETKLKNQNILTQKNIGYDVITLDTSHL